MGQEIIDNEPDELDARDQQQKREEFYNERMLAKQAAMGAMVPKLENQTKKAAFSIAKSLLKKKIIIWVLSISLPVLAIIIGIILTIIFIMMVLNYSQSVSL
ncbi:hypothetical protein KKF64_02325 [Patescibacteria group bacterium]|nr:hypothetical protein [Patescibacteria group bacterium]